MLYIKYTQRKTKSQALFSFLPTFRTIVVAILKLPSTIVTILDLFSVLFLLLGDRMINLFLYQFQFVKHSNFCGTLNMPAMSTELKTLTRTILCRDLVCLVRISRNTFNVSLIFFVIDIVPIFSVKIYYSISSR